MSLTEMKNAILYKYHKDINYWWRLLGEMFEGTDGFTKPYKIKSRLDEKYCYVSWENYNWHID